MLTLLLATSLVDTTDATRAESLWGSPHTVAADTDHVCPTGPAPHLADVPHGVICVVRDDHLVAHVKRDGTTVYRTALAPLVLTGGVRFEGLDDVSAPIARDWDPARVRLGFDEAATRDAWGPILAAWVPGAPPVYPEPVVDRALILLDGSVAGLDHVRALAHEIGHVLGDRHSGGVMTSPYDPHGLTVAPGQPYDAHPRRTWRASP